MEVCPLLREKFKGVHAFQKVIDMDGVLFRDHKGRRTLRFSHDNRNFFLKIHPGVGWKEIIKNLLFLRKPVLSARNEWLAIKKLQELGILTMSIAGYGAKGWNPANIQSFLITDAIEDIVSLEDLAKEWQKIPPPPAMKRALIHEVATIGKTLHENGVNHRDFYICHFLLDNKWLGKKEYSRRPRIFVIDLHRAYVRSHTPERWIVKDLAGLYFSSMEAGLTQRDLFRFMSKYADRPLREVITTQRTFWRKVEKKAYSLYRKHCQDN